MNFMLTSFFTFRTRPTLKKLAGFSGSHGVNYLLHMVLFNIYLFLGVPPEWAPLPVYAVCVPVNFMLVRFVMRRKQKHGQEPEKITET
jgi:putative flippase GtrA